jgi:hypothetical protein
VAEDSAETTNLAAEHRDRLIALIGTWYVEAGKYDVLPDRRQRAGAHHRREADGVAVPRDRYVYRPNTQSVPFNAGTRVLNRPHSITAVVDIPDGGAEGVLLCQGTAAGGYSLYVKDGGSTTSTTTSARAWHSVSSTDVLPSGPHELRFEFEPTGPPDMAHGKGAPGRLQLYVDGELVGNPRRRRRRRSCSTPAA